jgi:hypothetical protein
MSNVSVVAPAVVADAVELLLLYDVEVAVAHQENSQAVGCLHHWLAPLKLLRLVLAEPVALQ